MAETAVAAGDGTEAPAAAKAAGFPVLTFMIAVVIAVLVSVGAAAGGVYYLMKSGKIAGLAGGVKPVEAAVIAPPKTHAVALDPLLVNLADAGGQSYLRLTVNLRVLDPPPLAKGEKKPEKAEEPKKGEKASDENEAALRDAALTVVGRETADELLAPNGKEELKSKLKLAMAEHVPELKITEVFFTEFLVQH